MKRYKLFITFSSEDTQLCNMQVLVSAHSDRAAVDLFESMLDEYTKEERIIDIIAEEVKPDARVVVSVIMMQDVHTDTGKVTKLSNDLWTESSFKYNNPEEAVRAALASSIIAHPDHELVMKPVWSEITVSDTPAKEPQFENLGSALRLDAPAAGRSPAEDS